MNGNGDGGCCCKKGDGKKKGKGGKGGKGKKAADGDGPSVPGTPSKWKRAKSNEGHSSDEEGGVVREKKKK